MLSLPSKIRDLLSERDLTVDILPLHSDVNGFLWRRHIVINKEISWYHKRFTLCHEFSHHFLGHDPSYDSIEQEREADQFAVSLLVPDEELLEELEKYEGDTNMLEKVFGIPKEILQKRILQIYK